MTAELIFHGGAGTVTGSCYELVHAGGRLMIDCGMFQGNKTVSAELSAVPLRTVEDRRRFVDPCPYRPCRPFAEAA